MNMTKAQHRLARKLIESAIASEPTQQVFAAKVGVTRQAVSQVELDQDRLFSPKVALKIEEHYGIPRHALRPDIYPKP